MFDYSSEVNMLAIKITRFAVNTVLDYWSLQGFEKTSFKVDLYHVFLSKNITLFASCSAYCELVKPNILAHNFQVNL